MIVNCYVALEIKKASVGRLVKWLDYYVVNRLSDNVNKKSSIYWLIGWLVDYVVNS